MSDYNTQSNAQRADGVGAKGLLIAALVIVAFIFGLAMLAEAPDPAAVGAEGAATEGAAPAETAPAAESTPVVPTE
ncbi:MAG: hypothetical protein AAF729_09210 [Pseudomonadota bacterium]